MEFLTDIIIEFQAWNNNLKLQACEWFQEIIW